ncbi:hypothetical protein BLOT_013452 [Blomia tropicalis]|nr:hypothetical protein BLOT_013452 [Blomia tropicalis]
MAEVIPTHHEYDNSNNTILYVDPPYLEAIPDPHWQLFLIVIYSATSLSSFMANMITIGVLIRGDHINTELWKFLLNLSIADIVMGIFCIPFTYTNYMYGHWIFPLSTCRVVNFLQVCSVSVSIWTLTIIGIDRHYLMGQKSNG